MWFVESFENIRSLNAGYISSNVTAKNFMDIGEKLPKLRRFVVEKGVFGEEEVDKLKLLRPVIVKRTVKDY